MASIEKRQSRGKTVYYVKIRQRGYPSQSATLPSLAAARQRAVTTEAAMQTGHYLPTSEAKQRTLGELIDRYIDDVLSMKRPSTIPGQIRHLRWWHDKLGYHTLAEITPAIIVQQRDKLARGRKGGTVNRYLAALSHVFTVANREWQWIDTNPVSRVRKMRESRGRVRFLSTDERERLLTECRVSRCRHLYTLVILALSTGARHGELINLRWKDLDLERGAIYLDDTKNGERRTLPLTGHALDLMHQHAKNDSKFLFPSMDGKQPASIRKAFEKAIERAGLPDFRFHDLRHTAASYLAMSGASLLEIAEILGHKSLAMTQRYAHLSHGHTRLVVERMNQSIFGGGDQ